MISTLKRVWQYFVGNSDVEIVESELITENNKRNIQELSDECEADTPLPNKRLKSLDENDMDKANNRRENAYSFPAGPSFSNKLTNGAYPLRPGRSSLPSSLETDKTTPITNRHQNSKPQIRRKKENVPLPHKPLYPSYLKNNSKTSALDNITKMRERLVYSTLINNRKPISCDILNSISRSKVSVSSPLVDLTKEPDNSENIKPKLRTSLNNNTDIQKNEDSTSRFNISPYIAMRNKIKPEASTHTKWIEELKNRFDQKETQRKQKIADEKVRSQMLHDKNKIFDQILLERLLQQLHVKEVIDLEEDDQSEFEETVLPKFTEDQENRIKKAMRSPSQQQLIQKFGYIITGACVNSLNGLNWLNDNVINFYMKLLTQRGEQPGKLKVYAMDSFFCVNLRTRGYSSVRRWTRKVDIFSYDLMPIPVHVNSIHWCMLIIDFREKSLNYYDSMGSSNKPVLDMVEQYLKDESMDKKKTVLDFKGWTKECVKDIPQQMNGCDCGVFSCMFAEYICRGARISFTQQEMPYFRRKMCLEILEGKLLT